MALMKLPIFSNCNNRKSHIRVEANYGHTKTGNKTPDRGVWSKIPYHIYSKYTALSGKGFIGQSLRS